MGARRLTVVPEVRGSQERGGLKMLANGLDQVRWRQFVLASVDRTLWRSVRERQRKYLSAMTRNKCATHVTFVVLWAMRWNKRATDPMESGCLPTCISTLSATLYFAVYLLTKVSRELTSGESGCSWPSSIGLIWVYWTTLAWWFLSRPIWWNAIISLLINV